MTGFTHTHTSSRFSRTPQTLTSAAAAYMGQSDLVTFTEVGGSARAKALRVEVAKRGWGFVNGNKGGMDDCAIAFAPDRFDRAASGTIPLSNATYDAPGGGLTFAAWAVLEEEPSGKRLLVIVAHLASGVERGGGLKGARARVAKWRADTKALKAVWNRLAHTYKPDAILVTCDWNVNIKRRAFRLLFRRMAPGMRLTVNPKALPKNGTYGARLIDFSLVRGSLKVIKAPTVLAATASSDHRPFRQTLAL